MRAIRSFIKISILLVMFILIALLVTLINNKFMNIYGALIIIDRNQISTVSVGVLSVHTTIAILALAIYQITLNLKNTRINTISYYEYIFLKKRIFFSYRYYEIFIVILGSILINIFFMLVNNISALISIVFLSMVIIFLLFFNTVTIINNEVKLKEEIIDNIHIEFGKLVNKTLNNKVNAFEGIGVEKIYEIYGNILYTALNDIKLFEDKKEMKKIVEIFKFLILLQLYAKEHIELSYIRRSASLFKNKYNYDQYKEIYIELNYRLLAALNYNLLYANEETIILLLDELKILKKYFFSANIYCDLFFDKNTIYNNYNLIEEIITPYKNENLVRVIMIDDEEIINNYDPIISLERRKSNLNKISWEQLNGYCYYNLSKKIIAILFTRLDKINSKDILFKLGNALEFQLENNKIIENRDYVELYNKYINKMIDFYNKNSIKDALIYNVLNRVVERKTDILFDITKNLIQKLEIQYFFHVINYLQRDYSYEITSDFFMNIIIFLFIEYYRTDDKEKYPYSELMKYKTKEKISKFDKNRNMSILEIINDKEIMKLLIQSEINRIDINSDKDEQLTYLMQFTIYYCITYNDKESLSYFITKIRNKSNEIYNIFKNTLFDNEIVNVVKEISKWAQYNKCIPEQNYENICLNLDKIRKLSKYIGVNEKNSRTKNKKKKK